MRLELKRLLLPERVDNPNIDQRTQSARRLRIQLGPLAIWGVMLGTVLISLVRSLGNEQFGVLPALSRLQSIKFLDPALVMALLILVGVGAILKQRWMQPRWRVLWLLCTILMLLFGIIGTLEWNVQPYYAFQSIFFILRPALIFLLFSSLQFSLSDYRRMLIFMFAYSVLNASVVLYQYITLLRLGTYFSADAIIGIFNDAHQQSSFSYTIALLLIGYLEFVKRPMRRMVWLVVLGLNLVAAYVSQGQKATGIFAVVLFLGITWRILRNRRRLALTVLFAPLLLLALVMVFLLGTGGNLIDRSAVGLTGNLSNRLSDSYEGRSFLSDIGVVQMVTYYGDWALDDPVVLLTGLGPSNFGSPACLTKVLRDEAEPWVKTFFWWELATQTAQLSSHELRLLGISFKTSIFGIALGELGVIGFMAFLFLTLRPFYGSPSRDMKNSTGSLFFWLKMAYLFLVLQGVVNTLGSWDNDIVFTLLIIGFVLQFKSAAAVSSKGN